jgi:hypothetical protein
MQPEYVSLGLREPERGAKDTEISP